MPRGFLNRARSSARWRGRRHLYYGFSKAFPARSGCYPVIVILAMLPPILIAGGAILVVLGAFPGLRSGVFAGIALIGAIIYFATRRRSSRGSIPAGHCSSHLPNHLVQDPVHQAQRKQFELVAGRPVDWREYALAINAMSVAGYTWDWHTKTAKRY